LLCFSPSGERLVSASADHTIKLWDVHGGEDPITLLGHTARVQCVAFSPDGSLVAGASDDQTVRIWEARTGQALMLLAPGIGPLLSVAFSPDGTHLAAGSGTVCLYQLTSRQEKRRLAGHSYMVKGLTFHPFKPLLASGSEDKTLILWDLQTGRPQRRWQSGRENPIHKVAFAPNGEMVALGLGTYFTASGTDFSIDLWEMTTGQVRRRLVGPRSPVTALVFDSSSKLLASGTSDGMVFIWNTQTGKPAMQWNSHSPVVEVVFLSNGAHLMTGETGGRIAIHDLASGREIQQSALPGGLTHLAVPRDEHVVAVGGEDGALRLLTLPYLQMKAMLENAHNGQVATVAFSPDGRLLATAGTDRRIALWHAHTYERLCILPQTSPVEHIAFDPDGLRLAICGREELITLWNLALVQPELAAVGLDWDAPLAKATLQIGALADAQPPPVKMVQAPPSQLAAVTNSLNRLDELYRQGRFEEVIRVAETAVHASPDVKQIYVPLAVAHYQLGHYTEAAETTQRHLALCPDCPWALDQLAACRMALDSPEEAIKLLNQALQANPDLPGLVHSLARIYANGPSRIRDPDKALPLAQRANYQNTLGVVYYRLGRYAQAVDTLERSLRESNQGSAPSDLFFLAMCHARRDDAGKAKDNYDRAVNWVQERQGKLSPHSKKLEANRAEAEGLLKSKAP
jgi:WD40 repeat protein/Flp pilus assembly protein TadD